jgi:N12 class adenine-specific DNA methylase
MLGVRDAVRLVFQTQLDDAPADQIAAARRRLNASYDAFVFRFGPVSSRENVKAFAGDPDQPLLLSLENYDPDTRRATKTAIFERQTLERYKPVEHVETAAEALAVSLNETGEIHWPRMEQVTGQTARQLQHELGGLVYRNPEGAWETADQYLSGDVRAKLASARSATALDAAYQRNIEALEAVQPPDLQPGEIEARLGSSWVPATDIRDFVAQLLDIVPDNVRVAHAEAIATWTLEINSAARWDVSNTTTYGTARFRASDLIEDALNGRTPTAYDEREDGSRVVNQQKTIAAREKLQQIKDRFREWVWEEPERASRLAREYNDRFNNLRLRTFDGSHLTLPGMVREPLRDHDLARHQKDAVWRVLQSGSTLLAHVVGAGKTWTMAASAMEMRRLGLAKKPMFVVPNHLVEQWGAEFLKLYPQARLFIAGRDHFSAGNRQRAMARIASGNYDAVIVSHRSFEFLPVSDKLFSRFMGDQAQQLEDAILEAKAESGDNRRIVKELEKAKKRLAAKLKQRADRERKDNSHLRATRRRPDLCRRGRCLQESFLHDENEPHRRPAEFGQQPRFRYVHEDPLHQGADRRPRRRLRHRHADLEYHGRNVHDAPLSRSGSSGGPRRRAFRRLGGEFRGGRNLARTGARRIRLPHAHPLREIHQPAGASVDVPQRLRRADGGHAQPAAPGYRNRQAADYRRVRKRTAQGLHQDPHGTRRTTAQPPCRSVRRQHAQDHGRRP